MSKLANQVQMKFVSYILYSWLQGDCSIFIFFKFEEAQSWQWTWPIDPKIIRWFAHFEVKLGKGSTVGHIYDHDDSKYLMWKLKFIGVTFYLVTPKIKVMFSNHNGKDLVDV